MTAVKDASSASCALAARASLTDPSDSLAVKAADADCSTRRRV